MTTEIDHREMLRATAHEMRYAFGGWAVVGLLGILLYFLHFVVAASLTVLGGMIFIQFCYHVRWEHMKNDDLSIPQALLRTIVSYIFSIIIVVVFFSVAIYVESVTSLPILLATLFLVPVLFFGYAAYHLDLPKDL